MTAQPIHDYIDEASPAATAKVFMTDAAESTLFWANQDDLPEFANRVSTSGDTMTGDLQIDGSANGIILQSPDLTYWRITVDNSGVLSVDAV
jgi:hypothetical protein